MAHSYGNIGDVGTFAGSVLLDVEDLNGEGDPYGAVLTPDEARLLGLRLIRLADKAEEADW